MNDQRPAVDSARERIDEVDKGLLELLRQRMDIVRSVGESKLRERETILDPDREREVVRLWAEEARRLGFSEYHWTRILREILISSRRAQATPEGRDGAQVTVAFQGEPASYSDMAVRSLLASRATNVDARGFSTFDEVVRALESGDVDYALLPVENSTWGSIGEVNQFLARRDVSIVDEEVMPVEHCLAGLPGASPGALEDVRSHPVALKQCQRLFESLPRARSVPHEDTATAARFVADERDPRIAAICSEEAAHRFGLQILRQNVSDQPNNRTRFLLLAREPEVPDSRQPAKTTILFTTPNRCGALAECLQIFADYGVNLTRLESRPHDATGWEYEFLADLDGHLESTEVAAALDDLRAIAPLLKLLGTYPSRTHESTPLAVPAPSRTRAKSAGPKPSPDGRSRQVDVGVASIGGRRFTLILGPCAVESEAQLEAAAGMAKRNGAHILRGGVFKPRTSPTSFQGLGFAGLDLLRAAGERHEIPIVTEVIRPEHVERLAEHADMLQVGTRNMQNFALLAALGQTRTPVLLKRGMSATLDELLQAAEYIRAGGNHQIVLCERGIRTFERATRATLDLSAVPVLKSMTSFPVIVDPSHAAGRRELVVPLAVAAAAIGADGVIVECHANPAEALCDGDQALGDTELAELGDRLGDVLEPQGRTVE